MLVHRRQLQILSTLHNKGTQQFGGRQFYGISVSASQFGGKINKNNLLSQALKRQPKSFVMSLRQLRKQLKLFS